MPKHRGPSANINQSNQLLLNYSTIFVHLVGEGGHVLGVGGMGKGCMCMRKGSIGIGVGDMGKGNIGMRVGDMGKGSMVNRGMRKGVREMEKGMGCYASCIQEALWPYL